MLQAVGQEEVAVAASSSVPEMPVRVVALGHHPPLRAAGAAVSRAPPLLLVLLVGVMSLQQAIPPSMPVAQGVRDTPMTTAHGEQDRRTVVI